MTNIPSQWKPVVCTLGQPVVTEHQATTLKFLQGLCDKKGHNIFTLKSHSGTQLFTSRSFDATRFIILAEHYGFTLNVQAQQPKEIEDGTRTR